MTISVRVSTSVTTDLAISTFKDAQNVMQKLSKQTSGQKATDTYSDFGDAQAVNQFLSISNEISNKKANIASNEQLYPKLQILGHTLLSIEDVIREAKSIQVRARNPNNGNFMPTAILAQNVLRQLESLLNTEFGGQYLFAGTSNQTQPVVNLATVSNLSSFTVTGNYYQGNSGTLAQVVNGTPMQYGINADDIGFKNLIGALNFLILGGNTGNDSHYSSAGSLLDQAESRIQIMIASTGLNSKIAYDQAKTDQQTVLQLTRHLQEQNEVDYPTLMAQISQAQTALMASYKSTATLSSLSIIPYLK